MFTERKLTTRIKYTQWWRHTSYVSCPMVLNVAVEIIIIIWFLCWNLARPVYTWVSRMSHLGSSLSWKMVDTGNWHDDHKGSVHKFLKFLFTIPPPFCLICTEEFPIWNLKTFWGYSSQRKWSIEEDKFNWNQNISRCRKHTMTYKLFDIRENEAMWTKTGWKDLASRVN